MTRSFTYTALTLRVKASGESNREAWFLSSEEGIVRATVFGGPKSRLRSLVAPFHSGTLWVYQDPVRDSRKVTDFDVTSYRVGIRELWERAMTAGAIAETILASHGSGGTWNEAATLANNVLDVLDAADAALCSLAGIYFLWHWAGLLGVKPGLASCASCSRELAQGDSLMYSAKRETLFCENCFNNTSHPLSGHNESQREDPSSWFRVGAGARHWLNKIETINAETLSRVTLDTPSLEQARWLSKAVLAGALGKRLATWDGI